MRGIVRQAAREGKEISKKKLIAYFALDECMTERTVRELVQLFIDAGEFQEEGDLIFYAK